MKWIVGHGQGNGNQFEGFSHTGDTVNKSTGIFASRWETTPGIKVISAATMRYVFTADIDATGYFVVIRKTGSDYQIIASEEISLTAASGTTNDSWALNLPVLISSGYDHYYGVAFRRGENSSSSHPGTYRQNDANLPDDNFIEVILNDDVHGVGLPANFSWVSGSYLQATNFVDHNASLALDMTYESVNGVEAEVDDTYDSYDLPRPYDGRAVLLHRDVVVADGNTLTVTGDSHGTTQLTYALDMGATDQVTLEGVNETLGTIGGAAQAGHTFDMALLMDANDGDVDLVWLNKTRGAGPQTASGAYWRDLATSSHAAAQSGRDTDVGVTGHPRTLAFSGTHTRGNTSVVRADRFIVALGDSQLGKKNPGVDAAFDRVGDALEGLLDGKLWNAAIAGGRADSDVTSGSTAAKTRYNGTAGQQDLIEIIKKGGGKLWACIGLNDCARATSDASALSFAEDVRDALDTIAADLGNGSMVVTGLPPYSASDRFKAASVRHLNKLLAAMCRERGIPFVCPWEKNWDGSYASGVWGFANTSDGGTHYDTTGENLTAEMTLEMIQRDLRDDSGIGHGFDLTHPMSKGLTQPMAKALGACGGYTS